MIVGLAVNEMEEVDNVYVVYFIDQTLGSQLINATSCDIAGEHLVFFRHDGKLAALFLLEVVKDWSRIDIKTA